MFVCLYVRAEREVEVCNFTDGHVTRAEAKEEGQVWWAWQLSEPVHRLVH